MSIRSVFFLVGGSLVMSLDAISMAEETKSGFLDALAAPGSSLGSGGTRQMYDLLIGSWDAEVIDRLPDGGESRQSAEMHFAWVLEGRVIQDLWIAPARRERSGSSSPGNRFGTTLRVYDPALDAWRITWINPVTGVETRLVGRLVGSQIVQTGADTDGSLVRWVFVEVTPERFHWRGEVSEDGGASWQCLTEISGPPAACGARYAARSLSIGSRLTAPASAAPPTPRGSRRSRRRCGLRCRTGPATAPPASREAIRSPPRGAPGSAEALREGQGVDVPSSLFNRMSNLVPK